MTWRPTIADPLERLKAITHRGRGKKRRWAASRRAIPTDFPSLRRALADVGPGVAVRPLAAGRPAAAGRQRGDLQRAGRAVRRSTSPARSSLTYYPVSIPSHGMALNITVQSYNGMLDFGLIACRRAVPDVEDIADYLLEEHRAILTRIKAIEASEATPHLAAATAANAAAKPHKAPAGKKAAPTKRWRARHRRASAPPPRLRADAQAGRPGLHPADHARPASKPCARNRRQHLRRRVSGAQLTSRPPEVCGSVSRSRATGGSAGVERHLGAVAGPVAARRAGDEAVARHRRRRRRAAAPAASRSPRRGRRRAPARARGRPGRSR